MKSMDLIYRLSYSEEKGFTFVRLIALREVHDLVADHVLVSDTTAATPEYSLEKDIAITQHTSLQLSNA